MSRMAAATAPPADNHFEMVSLASRTERANQPRHLVILGVVALFACLLALLVTWGSYRNAREAMERQRNTARNVVQSAGRLKALQAAAAASGEGPRLADAPANILGTIESAGAEARLRDAVRAPSIRTAPRTSSNTVRSAYAYDVRDPSLSALIDWIERSTQSVPGLEAYAITVNPEAQQWRVRVTFSRWQRADGP